MKKLNLFVIFIILFPCVCFYEDVCIAGTPRPTTGNWDVGAYQRAGTPGVSVLPTTILFSKVAVGAASTPQTITVTSSGTGSLTIGTITMTGSDAGQFSKSSDSCSGQVIASGSSCTVQVTFTPASTSAASAALSIPSDDPGSPASVSLSGNTSSSNPNLNVSVSSTNATTTITEAVVTDSVQGAPSGFTTNSVTTITATTTSSVANIAITYQVMPSTPVYYKAINGSWKMIYPTNQCSGISNITINNGVMSFDIADNSECDGDPRIGYISIPVALGTADSGSSGSGSSSGGGDCFIATAAYGSYLDPHVDVLRNFRDNYLLTNRIGRAFVNIYYHCSPPVAQLIREHESLRLLTRTALTPIVYSVEYPVAPAFVFCISVGIAAYRRRKGNKA